MNGDGAWGAPPTPRPYVRPALEPALRADGLTGDWADAMAEARAMHEAMASPVAGAPRHARRRVFLGAVARAAGAALVAVGTFLAAAGAAVAGWAG